MNNKCLRYLIFLSIITSPLEAAASIVFCSFSVSGIDLITADGPKEFSGVIYWEIDDSNYQDTISGLRIFSVTSGRAILNVANGENKTIADIQTVTTGNNINDNASDVIIVNHRWPSTITGNPKFEIIQTRFTSSDNTILDSNDIPTDLTIYNAFSTKRWSLEAVYDDGQSSPEQGDFENIQGFCSEL